MTKKWKISSLKKKAAKLYTDYKYMIEPYDCGTELAEYINPELVKIKTDFNAIMVELKELDPKCPDFTLPKG